MRCVPLLAIAGLLVLPTFAAAKFNRTYLVPAYEPCPGSSNCNPPKLSSSYTFDSIALLSSGDGYIVPKKPALIVIVKGLRDGSGNLVNGTITASTGHSVVTTSEIGTIGEDSPLQPLVNRVYSITIKNGAAKFVYATPDTAGAGETVANSVTSPVVYDPDGKPLATAGARSKPAR